MRMCLNELEMARDVTENRNSGLFATTLHWVRAAEMWVSTAWVANPQITHIGVV